MNLSDDLSDNTNYARKLHELMADLDAEVKAAYRLVSAASAFQRASDETLKAQTLEDSQVMTTGLELLVTRTHMAGLMMRHLATLSQDWPDGEQLSSLWAVVAQQLLLASMAMARQNGLSSAGED